MHFSGYNPVHPLVRCRDVRGLTCQNGTHPASQRGLALILDHRQVTRLFYLGVRNHSLLVFHNMR
jgi:hypothetical protein